MEDHKPVTISHLLISSVFWPNSVSRIAQLCFLWVSNLHLLVIFIYIQIQVIPSSPFDSLVLYIDKISKILVCKNILDIQAPNLQMNIMLILNWIYFVLVLTTIGVIIVKSVLKKGLSQNQKLFTFYLTQFHLTIGFWGSCTFLVGSISISHSISGPSGYYNPNLMIFYIFLLVFYFLFGVIASLLSYDPFYSANEIATRNTYDQVILFVSKAIILPQVASEDTPQIGPLWGIAVVCFLMAVLRYFHLFKTFPYFHFFPMKFSVTFSCLSIIISFASIIKLAAQSDRTISIVGIVYTEILLGLLIIKISHLHLHNTIQNAEAKGEESLKSENEVFQRLFALIHNYKGTSAYAKAHKFNLNEIKFLPTYGNKLNKTLTDHEISNVLSEDIENNTHYNVVQEDREEAMKKIVVQMVTIAIKKIRSNNNLKIFLAQYTLQANTNLHMATSYLFEVSKSSGLGKVLATELLNNLERVVQRRYLNNEKDSIDIKSFVDFKERSTRFTHLISTVSKLYIQFWDAFLAPNLKLKKLHKLSCTIEKYDKKIKNIWTKEIEPHLRFASSLVDFYSSYLALITGAPHTSHMLNNKYRNLGGYQEEIAPLNEENIMSSNNISLKVSLNKANFGKIMRASPNIVDHLEWTHTEVVEKDINVLLLPSMKNKFNDSILRELEKGSRASIWNQAIDLFVMTKEGYIHPAYLYLAIDLNLQDGLTYLAILRLRRTQVQQMVLNSEGMLEGITNVIGAKLNVSMKKPVSIEELVCKNIEEIYNYDCGNTSGYVENTTRYSNVVSQKTVGTSRETPQKLGKMWWEAKNKDIILEFRKIQHNSPINIPNTPDTLKYKASITSKALFGVYFNILTIKERIDGATHYFDISPQARSKSKADPSDKKALTMISQPNIDKSADSIPNEQTEHVDEGVLTVGISDRLITTDTNRKLLIHKPPLLPLLTSNVPFKGIMCNRLEIDKTITNAMISQSFEVISEGSSSDKISENKKKVQLKSVKDPDAMSTQSVSYSTYSADIEKAVYHVPEQKGISLLRILSVLCSIFCGVLLITYQFSSSNSINNIGETTLIASNWTRQLGNLATINEWILRYTLLDSGVFQNDRYSWLQTPNFRAGISARFMTYINRIAPILEGLREAVSNLDYTTRVKFFEKIPVFDRDNNGNRVSYRSDDLFRITDQILSCMRRIIATDPNLVHDYSPYVAFITDNTLNESLVYGEGVVNLILQAIQKKLIFMKDLITCFTLIAVVANILLLCFTVLIVKTFINDRSRFLNILLRLDSKQIQEHLVLVSNLCKILEKETTSDKKLKNIAPLDLLDSGLSSTQTSQTYRARPASRISINNNLLKLAIGVLGLTIFLFSGYIMAIIKQDNQKGELQDKISLILDCDLIQYHAILLYYQTISYIGLNESTYVRDLPISQSWNVSYNIVTERLFKFVDLAQANMESGGNQQIVNYLTGNLCQLLTSQGSAGGVYCPQGLNGQTQKGLILVANHVMSTLVTTKASFDNSARTKSDMIAALGTFDIIESEPMAFNYWFPVYGVISNLVRNEYLLSSTNFSKDGLMIIWGVLYIVIGSLGWRILVLKYMEDRESWKNMVRMVPTSMIVNNKMLKAYLAIHNVHVGSMSN